MDALCRTFNPRTSHYRRDGWGRDSYISTNNGGFQTSNEVRKQQNYSPIRDFARTNAPNLHSRAVSYHANGTGRDSYIAFNQGGFGTPGSKETFYNSFRKDGPIMRARKNDFFSQTNATWMSAQQRAAKAQQAEQQKEVVRRLFSASPKSKTSPPRR